MDREDRWLVAWGVGYAAVGGASVLVPLYAIALGATPAFVGLVAATAALVGVPGALLWGRLAARTKRRRPFVLVALAATAGTLALVPLTASPAVVLLLNALLWFAISAASPVLNLIVVEGAPVAEWDDRIARLNAWQGYGWLGGLVLGTVWTALAPRAGFGPLAGQRLLFGLLAVTAGAGLALARLWYPERPHTDPERFRRVFRRLEPRGWGAGRVLRASVYGPTRTYWSLVSLRAGNPFARLPSGLRRYLLAVGAFSVGFAVFWGPVPSLLRADLTEEAVFGVYVAGNLVSAVCYAPAGRLVRRVTPRRLQGVALAARGLLLPLVALAGSLAAAALLPAYAVAFGLIGATWAVIAVTTTGLVTRLADDATRGEAFGLQAAIGGLAGGVGNALGGAVADAAGYLAAFSLAAAFVFLGVGLVAASR
ncbi:MFS transporter [Candidatus Halobonum tyrrellensis]|uniref:Major facilitator superfamily protein n=1 Tax=Candidatus Halobonum tyrrellensis G22 TaxID=1324957 RepID=V4IXI9_9EURY|nr:MFS transporter [Candidatus Halobonum tyrrellensis]ESP87872.1 major facilitator superfamily protein [Candidatus Halobonum tyrrellensis G22]